MARLRAKAAIDKVHVDTSDDILTFMFIRTINPLNTKVQILRNGKPIDVHFTINGKDPQYAINRAMFEGIMPTDRRTICPRCHTVIH